MNGAAFDAARRAGIGVLVLSAALAAADGWAARAPASAAGIAVRNALAATCHQQVERELPVGRSLPACARCVGIHLSGLLGGVALLAWPRRRSAPPLPALALAAVPLAVDVLAGMTWSAWDHPWLRFATGLLAGTAAWLALLRGLSPWGQETAR